MTVVLSLGRLEKCTVEKLGWTGHSGGAGVLCPGGTVPVGGKARAGPSIGKR